MACVGGWLRVVMAGSRKWTVESKEFELLIKEGASRARIFERNGKRQRTIFLQKIEIAWLARTLEDLVMVENYEVFWDQSRASFPRIIAQKCSNQNGNFLTIEEFDGRRRSGSIMIPKGRYGQGWECLTMEVHRANSSFHSMREVRECSKVSKRQSFAEVVGWSQNQQEVQFPAKLRDGDASTMIGDGFLEKTMKTGVGLAPEMVIGDSG